MTLARWFHATIDETMLLFGTLAQAEPGFGRTESPEPLSYGALYEAFHACPPRVHWNRAEARHGALSGWQRVPVEVELLGAPTCLDLRLEQGERPDTLIVHHHGLRELRHTLLPHALSLQAPLRGRCDWVALKAIYHESGRRTDYLMACRNRLIRAIAASVAIAREVREHFAARYRHVILSGVSLGGIVCLGNAAFDGGFCAYVPIVSGPDLRDVLFCSSISRIFHAGFRRRERERNGNRHLDLARALEGRSAPPIRALLGRYDQVFRLEPQLRAYARVPAAKVRVVERGHLTGPGSVNLVARHLRAVIDELERTRATARARRRRHTAAHALASV